MKKTVIVIILVVILSMLVACSVDAPSRPDREARLASAAAPLPSLLPASTLVAIELHDLSRRWSEIRSLTPIAALQDRLLAAVGLAPDLLPELVSDYAVVALIADDRMIVPVALLRPRVSAQADSALASLEATTTVLRSDGAIWIGPAQRGAEMEALVRGDGTSFSEAFPVDEVESRLPPGGLARGFVNPAALAALLRARIPEPWSTVLDLFRSLIATELEAVRWIGFRRDVASDRIVTDALVVYDKQLLPPEIARVFNPAATSPPVPSVLPEDIVAVAAFRPEASASLAWLRFAAGRDARGPLRNLEFWLREFEERSGRSLQHDFSDTIGEHGWLLSFEPLRGAPTSWILVLESGEPRRAEATLLAMRDWSIEHAWVRTLGLAVPRIRDYTIDRDSIRAVAIRTPLGELEGPQFGVVDGLLLIGSGRHAFETALTLARSGAFSRGGAGMTPSEAHAVFSARGRAATHLAASIEAWSDSPLSKLALDVLPRVAQVSADLWYEPDGLRLHGEVLLR